MGKVVELDVATRLDIPPERVLRRAIEAELETAVVLGWDKDGGFYAASSAADGGDVLWLMKLCEHQLLRVAHDDT